MSWAVVRVRGQVNIKPKIKRTMKIMRLNRVNHCVIIPENEVYKGMLNIVKDYVTWGEIDSEESTVAKRVNGPCFISTKCSVSCKKSRKCEFHFSTTFTFLTRKVPT